VLNNLLLELLLWVSCLTIGTEEGIKEVIEDLKKHSFGLKTDKNITDYLSCQIKMDEEKWFA
jgi:hypothetical protein